MKNIEKFADELNKIWGRDEDFAVIRSTNKPAGCRALYDCNVCLFDGVCSEKNKIGWLLGEYKEPQVLEVIRRI